MIIIPFAAGILCGYWLCREYNRSEITRLEKTIKMQRETMHALSRSLVNANLKGMAMSKIGVPDTPILAKTKLGRMLARYSQN